ncbi:MAG: asparagine synthase (glutamine-hydrolyzing) [Gemmatimonadota bacterium]
MCGITGFWRRSGEPADPGQLQQMCHAIRHRGPDDAGQWIEGGLALGHLRLSIIDLSPTGHQPMSNGDGSLRIVYNGELYNYLELGHELEGLGYVFRSRSDTEVVLHAWHAWGAEALQKFRGMWAFALWDARTRQLELVRDRYGIKPLYWSQHGETVGFASEMKALLPLLPQRTADATTLASLAVYQMRTDLRATTLREVRQVPPGTGVTVREGDVREWKWLDDEAEMAAVPRSHDPATLRRLLDESVALHLRSDVPVGACLSGGIDSSALVALAAPRLPYSLHSYSVVYPGTAFDERQYVHDVLARYPSVIHHESQPDGSDALDVLQSVVWHFEEPLWGEASYSWWHVMKLVGSHGTKVVVNGQGADELLAGYPYYYPSYIRQLLVQGRWGLAGRELTAEAAHQSLGKGAMARALLGPVWPGWLRRAARPFGVGHSFEGSALGPMLRDSITGVDGAVVRRGFWNLERHLQSDFEVTRLPMLLQAEDRFSMAFGIESRVPFITSPMVSYARTLPSEAKLAGGVTKVILREAMRGAVPDSVLDRPDKKGYPTPARDWFRGPQAEAVGDRLASARVRDLGLLDSTTVRASFDRFRRGAPMKELWRLLTLQEWGERFLSA